MKTTNQYTQKTAFINRQKELAYLHDRIAKQPSEILFIYGPKSSGKTTLLYKLIEEIRSDKTKRHEILHHNLRSVLIARYEDFIQTFFKSDSNLSAYKINATEKNSTLTFSLGAFSVATETVQQLKSNELDAFKVMEAELKELNKKGITPLIIIDELQALEGIYLNGQRELLKEMFNFFVAMTKESHLCHVIIASSDGYFLQRIYEDSKLKKTSSFFEVDYLPQADTFYWLNNLRKESAIKEYTLSEKQIVTIWDFFGGSCWEVSHFLGLLQSKAQDGKVADEIIEVLIAQQKKEKLSTFSFYVNTAKQQKLFGVMNTVVQQNPKFLITDLLPLLENFYTMDELKEELRILVQKNFIAFNPANTEFSLQGRSMEVGLAMYAEMSTA